MKNDFIIPTYNENRPSPGNNKIPSANGKIPPASPFPGGETAATPRKTEKKSKKIWKFALESGRIVKKYWLLISTPSGVRISEFESRIFLKVLQAEGP